MMGYTVMTQAAISLKGVHLRRGLDISRLWIPLNPRPSPSGLGMLQGVLRQRPGFGFPHFGHISEVGRRVTIHLPHARHGLVEGFYGLHFPPPGGAFQPSVGQKVYQEPGKRPVVSLLDAYIFILEVPHKLLDVPQVGSDGILRHVQGPHIRLELIQHPHHPGIKYDITLGE